MRFTYAGGAPALLEHWHQDVFQAHWQNPFSQGRPVFLRFDVSHAGKVSALRMEMMRDHVEATRASP